MPFKLKLKKSKQQYNVASKSVYVISVELLDNASIECTLTAESTGKHMFIFLMLFSCFLIAVILLNTLFNIS